MTYPTKGIPWDTPTKTIPLKDFEKIRILGRKQSMKTTGLLNRYTITHKDGKPIDPNKEYFVIEISDPDPREFEAALQFARICIMTGYENLGADIIRKLYGDYKADWYVETEMIEDLGPYPEKIAKRMEKEIDERHRYADCYVNSTSFNAEQFIKDLLEI